MIDMETLGLKERDIFFMQEALKEANKQLSIALKISIEESDKSITEQFKQDAVALAQDDRLAGRIAATDVGL